LGIHDLCEVAARFQAVADLTSGAFEKRRNQLEQADLVLIERIAGEDNNKHYRRLMSAIIAGVGQGPRGINAAHLTASLAVQMTFRWSPEYFSALEGYRDKLRRQSLNQLDQPSSSSAKRELADSYSVSRRC
jgi:hypothetical protein